MATQPSRAKQNSRGESALPEQYTIDFSRPVPGAGSGLPAYFAREEPGGGIPLVALQVRPEFPPPLAPLQKLAPVLGPVIIPGLMTPLAHGTYRHSNGGNGNGNGNGNGANGHGNGKSNGKGHGGIQEAYYLICPAPSGPPLLDTGAPWGEDDLIDGLLRPVAVVLERLKGLGMTHRAIRPDNLFRASPGAPVTLGCGWGTPAGLLQPAIYEPPYSAICVAGGRGAGHIGDDIYALAITMITLARGRPPLAGLDEAEIMRRKLDLGCHGAVTAEGRLPPLILELTRGMLAEDPEHRPTPTMLTDPMASRGRRLAARPMRRALRPIEIGGLQVWNGRMAAYAFSRAPEAGAKALRSGEIDHWLRRHLGDIGLASRIDEIVRQKSAKDDGKGDTAAQMPMDSRSDAMTAMRATVAFDPLAPLCWRGTALWPDALGPALAIARSAAQSGGEFGDPAVGATTLVHIEEIIGNEVAGRWAELRPERCDAAMLRIDARQHRNWQRQRGPGGGLTRLSYTLNPMLRCTSPLFAGRFVITAQAALAALEEASAKPELKRGPPFDNQLSAFISSRVDLPGDIEASGQKSPIGAALLPLRTLAALQTRLRAPPLPGLAQWLVDSAPMAVEAWNSRTRREQVAEKLAATVRKGDLSEIVRVLDDERGRDADAAGLKRAIAELARLDAQIENVGAAMEGKTEEARRLGQEVCVGIGVVSLVVSLGLLAL